MLHYKSYKVKFNYRNAMLFAMLLLCFGTNKVSAQLSDFQSAYFQNQYLSNPAMAGLEKGLNLNLGYQQQTASVPGQQKLQSITADYNVGARVGLGILVNNQQSGLISVTRVMATYAYHLPLNERSELNFGLSFGFNDRYLDYSKIVGDAADLQAQDYNQKNVNLDGDIGISYTSKKLTLQAAIPNINSAYFSTDANGASSVDRATFYTAAAYKISLKEEISIEPKVAMRGIKGFDDIFDAGFNLDFQQYRFNVLGIYHSNSSETLGIGVDLKSIDLLFTYTNSTGLLQGYNNNMLEAGVKLRLFK